MIDGFIKMPRALSLYSELREHDAFFVLYMLLCLMRFRETHMDGVHVGINQLVISKPELASRCNVSVSRLKYILSTFEKAGGITTENNGNKSTIITVRERYLPDAQTAENPQGRHKRYKNVVGQSRLIFGGNEDKAEKMPDADGEKKAYGAFMNVYLTDDEYNKLSRYSKKCAAWIDKLSAYMHSNGKDYPDHYATLIGWISDENAKNEQDEKSEKRTYAGSFTVREEELNAIMERARNTAPVLKKRNR